MWGCVGIVLPRSLCITVSTSQVSGSAGQIDRETFAELQFLPSDVTDRFKREIMQYVAQVVGLSICQWLLRPLVVCGFLFNLVKVMGAQPKTDTDLDEDYLWMYRYYVINKYYNN